MAQKPKSTSADEIELGMPIPETYADRVQVIAATQNTAKLILATEFPNPKPSKNRVEMRANHIIVLPTPALIKLYEDLKATLESKGLKN